MAEWNLGGTADPIGLRARHPVLGSDIRMVPDDGQREAFFAAGCFWGVEKVFWGIDGVIATAAGYMGGHVPEPTYGQVCTGTTGHAETVRVVFDPAVVDYASLVATFFEIHDPTQGDRQGNDRGPQYRSAIWTTGDDQLGIARATRDAYAAVLGARFPDITTRVAPADEAGGFWFAEPEHQAYLWWNPDGYQCHSRTGMACPVVGDAG